MAQFVNTPKIVKAFHGHPQGANTQQGYPYGTQTTTINTDKTGTPEMVGRATGPITKAISQRRSHRRQWRIFGFVAMVILDAALVVAAFRLAYFLRYSV